MLIPPHAPGGIFRETETHELSSGWQCPLASFLFPFFLQLVEVEVDVPDGMTIEEALSQHGPMVKVLLESPTGEDIEVPRGMNVATMVEAGLISSFDVEAASGEGSPAVGAGAGAGVGAGKTAPGVFDPAAVKGAEERSAKVSDLYAKVMANKAKAKAATPAKGAGSSPTTRNGYAGIGVKDEISGTNSWLSGVLSKGREEGLPAKKQTVHTDESSEHRSEAATRAGTGVSSASNQAKEDGEEMVGYDFILQDRGDKEGKVAKSARAMSRYVCPSEKASTVLPGFDTILLPNWSFRGRMFYCKHRRPM